MSEDEQQHRFSLENSQLSMQHELNLKRLEVTQNIETEKLKIAKNQNYLDIAFSVTSIIVATVLFLYVEKNPYFFLIILPVIVKYFLSSFKKVKTGELTSQPPQRPDHQ